MPHARTQIRTAAAAVLTGLATTGANVFKNRSLAIGKARRPALNIFTVEQEDEEIGMGPDPTVRHDLELVVLGIADQADDPSDLLDQITLEVETALAADLTLGGLAKDLMLTETIIARTGEGELEAGTSRQTYELFYTTQRLAPDVIT